MEILDFLKGVFTNDIMIVFCIAALGYLLGSISIKGLNLGTSGILIVALVFGHFNLLVPAALKNIGLICFVTAVGFIAGPGFPELQKIRYFLCGAGLCYYFVRRCHLRCRYEAGRY